MNFKEYQNNAIRTLRTNHNTPELELARLALGLSGEAGEVAEKVKKFLRDTNMTTRDKVELAKILRKEFGDCLWYIGALSHKLGLDLNVIAEENIEKLASRQERGKIVGSGDER